MTRRGFLSGAVLLSGSERVLSKAEAESMMLRVYPPLADDCANMTRYRMESLTEAVNELLAERATRRGVPL